MPEIYHEIEIKFKVLDLNVIAEQLEKIGLQTQGQVFEKTWRFDTPNNDLEKAGKFLRLRNGIKKTLTFKRKVANKEFKEREEIELEISDLEKIKKIFENLGYTKILIMEKYRQKWSGQGVEICLDKMPMGNYIEIEGKREAIKEMVAKLSFDLNKKIVATYWDLWREYAKEHNIDNENIIFKQNEK